MANDTIVPESISAISNIFVGYYDLLVFIGKFLASAFVIYLIYLAIMSFINWRKAKRIVRIENKIDDLNEKMNLVMKKLKINQDNKNTKKKQKDKNTK